MTDDDIELVREAVRWDSFETVARRNAEYAATQPYFTNLVERVMATETRVTKDTWVYRARTHPLDATFASEPLPMVLLGAPPLDKAVAGRLHAPGEYLLYAALDPETAVAEVRPWVGARLSVGSFRLMPGTRIVDLTTDRTNQIADPTVQWTSFMMARPVHREDEHAYVVTQLLARELRQRGISGVLYDSALTTHGTNIGLFDESLTTPGTSELKDITRVEYGIAHLAPDVSEFKKAKPPTDAGRGLTNC